MMNWPRCTSGSSEPAEFLRDRKTRAWAFLRGGLLVLALSALPVAAGTAAPTDTQSQKAAAAPTSAQAARTGKGDEALASLPAQKPTIRNLVRARGRVGNSLYRAGLDKSVPPKIMAEVVRMLGYGIDLERDLKANDRFEILFEQFFDAAGKVVRTGHLKYASITVAGRKLGVWRFEPKGAVADYFNARGESLRTAFLRTPIDGARLTSRFGKRRHPILGYTRMHRGLDFGAPTGTPVYAAGDGVVTTATRKGGYGRYIRVKHHNGYATAYAHLSSFAKGLRQGSRVRQGQVIGRVGATGLATGPHLHYEILRDGEAIDPSVLSLTPRVVLRGDALAAFRWHAALLKIRPAVASKSVDSPSAAKD